MSGLLADTRALAGQDGSVRMASLPSTRIVKRASGSLAGPFKACPARSNLEPWHGHFRISALSSSCCHATVQAACVHLVESARSSASGVRKTTPCVSSSGGKLKTSTVPDCSRPPPGTLKDPSAFFFAVTATIVFAFASPFCSTSEHPPQPTAIVPAAAIKNSRRESLQFIRFYFTSSPVM